MVEITDLSTLLGLLEKKPDKAFEVRIEPQVFDSLRACLKLGVRNAAQWHPAAFNPKVLKALFDPRQDINFKVRAQDFQLLIDSTHDQDATPLKVDKKLLDEGMAWVEEAVSGNAYFERQIQTLAVAIKSATDALVEAPKNFLQELVDWLDQIQRNRPNEVAEELRGSVRQHNSLALEQRPKGPYND